MAVTTTILVSLGGLIAGGLLFGARPMPASAWEADGTQAKLAFGPLVTVVLPVVSIAMGVAVAFAAASIPEHNELAVAATLVVAGLLALAGALGLRSSRAATWIDAVGIRARGSFGGVTAMRWSDVTEVRFCSVSGGILLIDRARQRIRVSPMVPGFSVFREMLEEKVHAVIVQPALEQLDRMKKRWST